MNFTKFDNIEAFLCVRDLFGIQSPPPHEKEDKEDDSCEKDCHPDRHASDETWIQSMLRNFTRRNIVIRRGRSGMHTRARALVVFW